MPTRDTEPVGIYGLQDGTAEFSALMPGRGSGRTQRHRRRVFVADVVRDGERIELGPHRGCWTRSTDHAGNVLRDYREPGRTLVANVGDRLIVCHSELETDEIAGVEVVAVLADSERLHVVTRAGVMPTSRTVHVIPAGRAKRKPRRKTRGRVAGAAPGPGVIKVQRTRDRLAGRAVPDQSPKKG